jgi:hypothetical protein
MQDTCQLAGRKALRYLCHMYDWHLGSTPMKYFPPLDHNHPAWAARIRYVRLLAEPGRAV